MTILFSSTRISKRNLRKFGRGLIQTKAATTDEARMHYLETTYTQEEKAAAEFFSMTLAQAREALDQDPHCLDNARTDMAERQEAFDRLWREEHEASVYGDMTSAYAH